MWLRWLPWRYMVRKIARAGGFIDPIALMTQFNRFSKPAEVIAPTELLRAGAVLAARGLINSQAIQHNLDWVWPYWVEQQFDPKSESFVPRAFSVTHINITHRNWTAVGYPGSVFTPVVDPRGLLMPFFDSWSLDFWVLGKGEPLLIPSRMKDVHQELVYNGNLSVVTTAQSDRASLTWRIQTLMGDRYPECVIEVDAQSREPGMLVASIRPYNPEGVSFIHSVKKGKDASNFIINDKDKVYLSGSPSSVDFSEYKHGDVYRDLLLNRVNGRSKAVCGVGMATAAAAYELNGEPRHLTARIPLARKAKSSSAPAIFSQPSVQKRWDEALEEVCKIEVPDERVRFLFDTAIRTMVLHVPNTVYAGPYTYKRFWFRDAVLIGHAMLSAGLSELVRSMVKDFPRHMTANGYFLSQQGEWDSNGQVLWLLERIQRVTGKPLDRAWAPNIRKAAQWIHHKRKTSRDHGLLPPGFSAEHLGPNDNYYWDDYWCAGGLFAAARMMRQWGEEEDARKYWEEGEALMASIDSSLASVEERLGGQLLPASPHRRMDSGAVGSLACTYPLQLVRPDDARVVNTLEYLLEECTIDNAFFHDISHSGINPYLTLHIAQALLRNEDERFWPLVERIGQLASPTGQWPEAIHPRLTTGCMGDGQHVWAAAEWVMMIRNCFVREELEEDIVLLCSGIPASWLANKGTTLRFGPTDTPYGPISVKVNVQKAVRVEWQASWSKREPRVEVAAPGGRKVVPEHGKNYVEFPFKG